MTKLSEFLTKLNDKIAAAKVSGFWSDTAKKEWINDAGERVCNYHRWKELEYALKTTTKAGQEYYDYPAEFQEDSIYYLEVDGKKYIQTSWQDYQEYKRNAEKMLEQHKSTEICDKVFTSHDGFYFINPTPTESDLEITIWGIKKWVKLSNDNDESILPSKFDEAIIRLALATCLQKERRYDEAIAERAEVEAPETPGVENSGGILARLKAREEDETPKGYIGQIKSTRFMM